MQQKSFLFISLLLVFCLFISLPWAEAAKVNNNISYLSFQDANLKDVLYMLAKQAGMNIILDEKSMLNEKEVKKITLNLRDVSFSSALDLIVSSAGLTYTKVGQTIIVGDKDALGRNFNGLTIEIIKLKYADAYKVKDTLVGLGLTDYNHIFVYGELNNDDKLSAKEKDSTKIITNEKGDSNESSTQASSDNDSGGDLSANKLVEKHIPENDKASLLPANILAINDTLSNIKKLKQVIKALDQPASKIMVEAKVLEINEAGMKKLGVDWILDKDKDKGILSTTSLQENGSNGVSVRSFNRSPLTFNAMIKAQIDNGNAKLLSSPKISTLDGKAAFIYVGDKIPYVSKKDTDDKGKVTLTVSFLNAGVTLEVLPIITENNDIQMKIYSEVSSLKQWVTLGDVQYPQPSMRQAETIARIKAGETIIIGGLIYDEEKKSMSKLPLLGDLPLVKSLFSWSGSSKSRNEVVISLTPYIVN